MNTFHTIFSNPLMALFAITGLGMLLGAISIKGLSIGTSGVLFVALVAGHFRLSIPDEIGRFGLAIFVYCVGIGAGGRFFAALAREGGSLAKLSLIIVASAAATAWGLAELLDLPPALAAGLFAGAMTSTPALAAATEGAHQLASDVAIGYGITYPFGVIGVVLFVQLLPRILRNRNPQETQDSSVESQDVEKSLIEVTNPNLFGSRIGESDLSEITECQVSRVMKEGRLIPLTDEDRFEAGQLLLVVGKPRSIHLACKYLGKRSDQPFIVDTENERQRFVVTAKSVAGQTLRELAPLRRHGVIITRITRLDQTFVPTADTRIETYDVLTVVGLPAGLRSFGLHIGHRPHAFDQTTLISIALGLSAGILLGMIPIGLPGSTPMTLGLAGGPLIVALILGHAGRIGPIVGHIARPTRLLLQDFGLVLFLADAGITGGSHLVETVSQHGWGLFGLGATVTLLPMIIAYTIARGPLKLTRMQSLGGICGGMTSTPALGSLTASTDSQEPIVSYATAYPIALILMTLFAKILIGLLGIPIA